VRELDGEVIQRADPHYWPAAPRDREAAETRTYLRPVPYMDRPRLRVDDVQRARLRDGDRESCRQVEVPVRAQYIRVMFDEITAHPEPPAVPGHAGPRLGAMTVFLYCFREREDLMDCYEAVSGARMHAAYYRPGGVYRDLPTRCRSTGAVFAGTRRP
jgi:NADH-quinone oxidoreductase subunit D